MRQLTVMMVMAVVGAAAVADAQVVTKDVDIKASDGVVLKGTYYTSAGEGPAMLLLHQCNMDRHAWDGLARDLAGRGIHVLTVDFRAFGESGGKRFASFSELGPVMEAKWPGDVDAMYAYLLSQAGVDRARVAVGGASCGVTQASDLAARRPEIKTMMVLSGIASDHARQHLAATPSLAVFGAASRGDTRAAEGIRAIIGASTSGHSKLQLYDGTEHGVPMFDRHAELRPMVVDWLSTQLHAQP